MVSLVGSQFIKIMTCFSHPSGSSLRNKYCILWPRQPVWLSQKSFGSMPMSTQINVIAPSLKNSGWANPFWLMAWADHQDILIIIKNGLRQPPIRSDGFSQTPNLAWLPQPLPTTFKTGALHQMPLDPS